MAGEDFVTQDHCELSTKRIEDKVDLLIQKLDPKLDMIVRVDAHMSLIKWAVGVVFSGGFIGLVVAGWKLYSHFISITKP